MKGIRLPKLFITVLLTAIVLASCGSTTKNSGITVTGHGVSSVQITKSVLVKRFLIVRGTCNTTGSTPAAPAIKFHVFLAHQQVAATAWECKKPQASFSFYLPSKDLSSNEELHMFSRPESKWVIEISGSNTKGSSKEFAFYSTYVPPKPKPPALPASAPLCTPGQVSVGITGEGYVANQVHAYLTVSDTSSSPCSLQGWPSIYGMTVTGRRISLYQSRAIGPKGHYVSKPPLVLIKKNIQSAYSELGYAPGCPSLNEGNKGTQVDYQSLSVALPDSLGTYTIPSSAFNEGSLVLTPVSCYTASSKLAGTVGYSFLIPSFGLQLPALF